MSVKGICLRETNYSEASKILNVYTEEFGMLGILSKSCRNLKSKLRGVSRKLLYGTYHIYYKEKGLSILIGVDMINGYLKTTMDLERVTYASYIADLTEQVIKQEADENLFSSLVAALEKIEEGLDASTITNIYEVKMLAYLGVLPSLDGCAVCGNKNNIVTISSDKGGLLCGSCFQSGVDRIVSSKTIKLLRMYYYVDLSKITKIEVEKESEREIDQFLEEYYEKYTGVITKSKKMLKEVKRMERKQESTRKDLEYLENNKVS